MADTVEGDGENNLEESAQILYLNFLNLNKNMLKYGLSVKELREICFDSEKLIKSEKSNVFNCTNVLLAIACISPVIILSIFLRIPVIESIMQNTLGRQCLVPNNYLVWEATRPITNCDMCKDVSDVLILQNVTRESFAKYAYSPRPMIAKEAAKHWPAMHTFTFNYFKDLYNSIDGAYESVEDECQILTFKTEFKTLEEVFAMPDSRLRLEDGEKPWYVGWSNCHPDVLEKIRSQYVTPEFLPEDAEAARMDYVFVGYDQGAVMHIDYISRLMWQAQIQGHKTWRVIPPPECDDVCSRFSFRVDPGDIVLLDTRQWYHDTFIDPGELSLTISSEYG